MGHIRDIAYRQQNPADDFISSALSKWGIPASAAYFLSSPKTGARNTVSGMFFNMEAFGVAPTLKFSGKALWASAVQTARYLRGKTHQGTADYIIDAIKDGTHRGDHVMSQELGQDSKLEESIWEERFKKGVSTLLVIQRTTEAFNRGVTSMLAMDFLKRMRAAVEADPNLEGGTFGASETRNMLGKTARMGFDGERLDALLADDPVTVRDFIRAAVWEKQFSYNLTQHPLWMDHPYARWIFQFQKWGYQRTRDFARNTVAPLTSKQKITLNGEEHYVLKKDAVANSLQNVAMMIPNGFIYATILRAMLDDEERREPHVKDIISVQDSSRLSMIISRLYSDAIYSGGAGVIGDYWEFSIKSAFSRGARYKSPAPVPPMWVAINTQIISVIAGFIQRASSMKELRDVQRLGHGVLRDLNVGRMPLVRQTDVLLEYRLLRMAGLDNRRNEIHDARKDVKRIQQLARRYADEKGLDKVSPFVYASWRRTIKKDLLDDLEEALMLGDKDEAKKVVIAIGKRRRDGKLTDGEIARAIKASVRARQPVDVDGVESDAERARFIAWAKRNAPHTHERIMRTGARYNNTAIALGLMKKKK